MNLKPGEYRYSELAELCGVSRTTAEKFKDRYALTEVLILYSGREVKGVRLSEENCTNILKDIQRDTQGVSQIGSIPFKESLDTDEVPITKISNLIDRVLQQSERIVEAERELAQKSSELMVLNRELESRNSAIVKYRDQEERNRSLEKENLELKARLDRLEEQIKNNPPKKPSNWMFWKN